MAQRSFLGHLEGTGKAAHTIRNYRLDLNHFHEFLCETQKSEFRTNPPGVDLKALAPAHVDAFSDFLRTKGLRVNTRRRKLLTVGKFLRYLAGRNKAVEDLGRKYLAPHKVERIPLTVPLDKLILAVRELPTESVIESRNRALLWVLAESGCLVSEASRLRRDDFRFSGGRKVPVLVIAGDIPREIPISKDLFKAVQALPGISSNDSALFTGFNRFGSMGVAITPRGIELLVRSHGPRLGFPELTPRIFRHSVAIHWFKQGLTREEVRKLLGLKTDYAFRSYEPLLKKTGADSHT